MTTLRKPKKSTPLEDFAEYKPQPPLEPKLEEKSLEDELDIRKLDIFAMMASVGVAKRIDDPTQVAHESFQIAFKMMELSEVYKNWKK